MSAPRPRNDPIGLLLRRADEAITAAFARELAALGLSRTAWQALNVVRAGGDVREALAPFAPPAALDGVVGELAARGLLAPGPQPRLTAEGAALLERAGARVAELRVRAVAGIDEDDYATTLRVLERVADNLEAG